MKIRRRHGISEEIPSSAMSDIAFLLIVFFMAIAIFAVKEGFKIKTPQKDQIVKKTTQEILKIRLKKDGILVGEKKIEKNNLKDILKEKQKEKNIVVLEIEAKTAYREVIFVLDIFAELSIMDFSMKKIEG